MTERTIYLISIYLVCVLLCYIPDTTILFATDFSTGFDKAPSQQKVTVSDDMNDAIYTHMVEYSAVLDELVNSINAYRVSNGKSVIRTSEMGMQVAMHRAIENATNDWMELGVVDGKKRHLRPDGRLSGTVLLDHGIRTSYGENLGRYQKDVEHIMTGWIESAPHNELLLTEQFNSIGVGVSKDSNGRFYWVLVFLGEY